MKYINILLVLAGLLWSVIMRMIVNPDNEPL